MKYTDICRFKGEVKSAVQTWCESKIDTLFPGKPKVKMFAKRALNNWMSREDEKLNRWIDNVLLFIGDEKGNVDSDTAMDMLMEVFKESEPARYDLRFAELTIGRGELVVELPSHPMLDLFVGKLGRVKFTCDDFMELKEMLN